MEEQSNILSLNDHKSRGSYTNDHLLHINSGVATEEQIRKVFMEALQSNKKLGLPDKTIYKISVVADRFGSPYGYSYMWVSSTEIFNMLIGRDPDGTERCQIIDDPNFVPKIDSDSWADIADVEDPPKIKIQLPELMSVSNVILTDEQKRTYDTNDEIKLKFGRTYVSDPPSKYHHNVLCGCSIPVDITINDLKDLFIPFCSLPRKFHQYKKDGIMMKEMYPLVSITSKRLAFITFDPSTQDAIFALKIAHKTKMKANSGKIHNLIFNQAIDFSKNK